MAFKLGDVIIDRAQFGYGQTKAGVPLYALTQLKEFSIELTADSTDITDARGNLVYRKYTGKKGEVTAQNAFMNFAVIAAIAATDAEIASGDHTITMPILTTVKAGEKLDITDYVENSIIVSGIYNGGLGRQYTLAAATAASATEFAISDNQLIPPTAEGETEYFVKYMKTVKSGAKVSITGKDYPKAHELFVKALAVDKCEPGEFRAVVIHISNFMPSPEVTLALTGGDSQTMDYKGSILTDSCSTEQTMVEVYFIDEAEEDA
jgi:hypothetical protein